MHINLFNIINTREKKDVTFLFLIQGINYLLPLLILPYLINILGSEKYGFVGFGFAYASYFVIFVDYGFNLSAPKRLISRAHTKKEFTESFNAILGAKILLFLICTPIYFIIPLFVKQLQTYYISILFSFPLLLGQTIAVPWYFQSIGKVRIGSMIYGVSKLILLPIIFFFVTKPSDYYIACIIQSSVILMSSIIGLIYLYRIEKICFKVQSFHLIKEELIESTPLFISNAATSTYTQCFTIILGLFSTPSNVGCYSAADRLIRALSFSIYLPFIQVYYPKIASLYNRKKNEAILLCKKVTNFLILIMLSLGIVILLFSNEICTVIGKDYDRLPSLMRILAFMPLAITIGGLFGQFKLIAMGDKTSKKHFRNTYIIAGVFSIFSILILAPVLKDIGAAVSMMMTEAIVAALMVVYSLHK